MPLRSRGPSTGCFSRLRGKRQAALFADGLDGVLVRFELLVSTVLVALNVHRSRNHRRA
jgi:hypothetical protein